MISSKLQMLLNKLAKTIQYNYVCYYFLWLVLLFNFIVKNRNTIVYYFYSWPQKVLYFLKDYLIPLSLLFGIY